MREIHGIADALKMAVASGDETTVTVRDGHNRVILDIGSQTFPGGLTPTQAEWIARELSRAARRVRSATAAAARKAKVAKAGAGT